MARKSKPAGLTQPAAAAAKKAPSKSYSPPPSDSEDDVGDKNKRSGSKRGKDSDSDEDNAFDLGLEDYNSSDDESDDEDVAAGESDEDEDGGAYNNNSDDSDDDDDNSNSDDSDDNNDHDNELKNLVNNLDPKMRQAVMRKAGRKGAADGDDSGSDDDIGGVANKEESWGKKKKTYWEGDTGDLEIGQDFEDAEDEEAAAGELHQQKLQRMTDADFLDDAFEENAAAAHVAMQGSGSKMVSTLINGHAIYAYDRL